MTNNYRICHVLTPSETNTRFICHVLTPSELFVNVYNVQVSAIHRKNVCLETYVMDIFSQLLPRRFQKT